MLTEIRPLRQDGMAILGIAAPLARRNMAHLRRNRLSGHATSGGHRHAATKGGATLQQLVKATGWQKHYADVRIMPTCAGNPVCGAGIAAMESA